MLFELLSAIELTATAAIVVAMLAFAFASTPRGRIEIAVAFAAWFVAVVVLGATDVFTSIGTPAIGAAVVLPLAAMCVAFFAAPSIRSSVAAMPLPILAAIHALRVLGVSFVALYAAGRLPAPFAPSAGWGDIFMGITALPVAWVSLRFGARAKSLIFAWNVLGTLDLVAAIGFAATSSPGPIQIFVGPPNSSLMTALPWLLIPCFLVPCYLFIHIVIFNRLARPDAWVRESSDRRPLSSAGAGPASAAGARA